MAGPSQLVKGIDDGIGVRGSQVDVDCGAVDGAVTKSGFKGQEVKAVLVAVGSVGMPEMGSPPFPPLLWKKINRDAYR